MRVYIQYCMRVCACVCYVEKTILLLLSLTKLLYSKVIVFVSRLLSVCSSGDFNAKLPFGDFHKIVEFVSECSRESQCPSE